ncbi:GIY-YIG nuclease family protein [Salinisphaera sp. T5B8]|uniref:GIY-YIG nuclease family protein n=1 Tax=Salinisphaera sp. T5B8 TaxID=1304154 RepID=UPI00333E8503
MSKSDSHRSSRLSEIAFWAAPAQDSPQRPYFERQLERLNRDPAHKKKIKKRFEKAIALFELQQSTGAGLLMDSLLREYHGEYNSRVLRYSLRDMPGSFNVLEAFNRFIPSLSVFKILEEKDHIFNFDDFLDFVTKESFESKCSNIKSSTEEGVIYSYNALGDPCENKFSSRSGKDYSIMGASLVRYGDEISIMMLAGQHCDLAAESSRLRELSASERTFSHRAHIIPNQDLKVRAEPVSEEVQLWRTIFLTRFDLSTATVDARYVYQDAGRSYIGITDDADCYTSLNGEFISPELERQFERSTERLIEFSPLLEVSKILLYLPDFFSAHDDDICLERHKTKFGENRNKSSFRKVEKLCSPQFKIVARSVATIALDKVFPPRSRSIATPGLVLQKSGYWKKLGIHEVGRDKGGRPIHGRTWVEKVLSWVAEPSGGVTVTRSEELATVGDDPGIIYVMRSAAHAKNIFKVGLTRRNSEKRSSELSRTTSSPDVFLVVEEWNVPDCALAESLCHQELEQYRINPRREFFQAPYSTISMVINRIVGRLAGA